MNKYTSFIVLFVLTLVLNESKLNAQKLNSIFLKKTSDWCSNPGDFKIDNLKERAEEELCSEYRNGIYFSFKAKSHFIKINIKTNHQKVEGLDDILEVAIFTWHPEDGLKVINCQSVSNQNEVSVCSNALSPKHDYIIGVFSLISKPNFKICLHNNENGPCENIKNKALTALPKSRIKGTVYSLDGELLINHKLIIKDFESQKTLVETTSRHSGEFEFHILKTDVPKPLELKSAANVELDIKAYLYDEDNRIIKKLSKNERGYYNFVDYKKQEPLLTITPVDITIKQDKVAMLGRLVHENNPSRGVANMIVTLWNQKKEAIGTGKTNARGDFEFNNLKASKGYNVTFEDTEKQTYAEIILIDDKLKTLMKANSNMVDENGWFIFEELPYMETKIELFELDDTKIDFGAIETGKALIFNNLHFGPEKDILLPGSFDELDELASYLKANPTKKIKVTGHTDSSGNSTKNKILSERRAMATISYLESKGIDLSRMATNGAGSSLPIGDNNTPEGRKKNRRVELEILN